MLTNFHLPRTSLLLLVCAFAGKELALAAYRHAVEAAVPLLFLRRLHVDYLICSVFLQGGQRCAQPAFSRLSGM